MALCRTQLLLARDRSSFHSLRSADRPEGIVEDPFGRDLNWVVEHVWEERNSSNTELEPISFLTSISMHESGTYANGTPRPQPRILDVLLGILSRVPHDAVDGECRQSHTRHALEYGSLRGDGSPVLDSGHAAG